jgi:hypothetical protein
MLAGQRGQNDAVSHELQASVHFSTDLKDLQDATVKVGLQQP